MSPLPFSPRNDLGYYAIARRWTGVAIMCYRRGCNCKGCMYENFLSVGKCQVKASVLESVRIWGSPCKTDWLVNDSESE